MLPADQLRALRDHARVIDDYDDALAAARDRLDARHGDRLAALERAQSARWPRADRNPMGLASVLPRNAVAAGEVHAALRDRLERRAWVEAGPPPAMRPDDTPRRLAAWIGEQLGSIDALESAYRDRRDGRRSSDGLPLPPPEAYRERADDLARQSYGEAHDRAMALTRLAPGLAGLLTLRDDPVTGLRELRRVMLTLIDAVEAASEPEPTPGDPVTTPPAPVATAPPEAESASSEAPLDDSPEGDRGPEPPGRRPERLINLDQAAALVNRTPDGLRHYRRRGMPAPAVQGRKGAPNQYRLSEMRPWLEATFHVIPESLIAALLDHRRP